QMAQGAGTVGESVATCTVGELLEEAMVGTRTAPTVHRDLPTDIAKTTLRLPPRAVSQALRSLVTNAQDASPPNASVVVAVREETGPDGAILAISIRDRGAGMPSDVLARIGEPFFTTKAPGRGMGLGLFLARAVIEGVGGSLQIDSRVADHPAGRGTEVRVLLPTDVSPRDVVGARTTADRSSEAIAPEVVSKPA
ncbi:MAG: ATP-binding protein, partial [Myxococcota bacterium]|nr:ATP-binding protein [Myxococcota bacterium]